MMIKDVQVAHKSERNLSSSSRHAYTFHIIGQNGRHDDDGDGGDYDGYGGDDVCGGNYDNDHQNYENGEPPCWASFAVAFSKDFHLHFGLDEIVIISNHGSF